MIVEYLQLKDHTAHNMLLKYLSNWTGWNVLLQSMLYIKNRSKKYSFKILTALIASLLFNACDVTDRNNHLNFDVYYGSKKLNCEASFTQNGQQWRVTQLQFYVHNIELQNNN